MIETLIGSTLPVFLGMTVVLFGGASWMAGRALATSWKPSGYILPYGILMGCGARFLTYALFQGTFLAWRGYASSTVVIIGCMYVAYRFYYTRQMVRQYPWMYEQRWLFTWRKRAG
jgi:branched-chain amino acid transport system ATP-binding protein